MDHESLFCECDLLKIYASEIFTMKIKDERVFLSY